MVKFSLLVTALGAVCGTMVAQKSESFAEIATHDMFASLDGSEADALDWAATDEDIAFFEFADFDFALDPAQVTQLRRKVVKDAWDLRHVKYTWGGNTPKQGMDCSGYMRWVLNENGVPVKNRTAHDMMKEARRVEENDVQPGDLVFFASSPKARISHVGMVAVVDRNEETGKPIIYIIHTVNKRLNVKIQRLTGNTYWGPRIRQYGTFFPTEE